MTDKAINPDRQEETIASVRADLELQHAEKVEARRIATKRALLEEVVRQGRVLEESYQAIKEHKKVLKNLRNDLVQLDHEDVQVEILSDFLKTLKSTLGTHDGGVVSLGIPIAAIVAAPPMQPPHPSDDPRGYNRKRA